MPQTNQELPRTLGELRTSAFSGSLSSRASVKDELRANLEKVLSPYEDAMSVAIELRKMLYTDGFVIIPPKHAQDQLFRTIQIITKLDIIAIKSKERL